MKTLPIPSIQPPLKSGRLREILEESWVAKVPGKPRRFRSPKKQKLAEIMREHLHHPQGAAKAGGSMRKLIGDLIGSVRNDGLPKNLSSKKKKYLPALIHAKKRHHR